MNKKTIMNETKKWSTGMHYKCTVTKKHTVWACASGCAPPEGKRIITIIMIMIIIIIITISIIIIIIIQKSSKNNPKIIQKSFKI